MLGQFNDLNSGVIADLGLIACWKRHLGKTEGAVVLGIGRTGDLEDGQHGVGEVQWFIAVAHVDIYLGQ